MMDRAISSGFPRLTYYLEGFLSPSWHRARAFFRASLSNTVFAFHERVSSEKGGMVDNQATNLSGGGDVESVLSLLFDKPEQREQTLAQSIPEHELLDELSLFLLCVILIPSLLRITLKSRLASAQDKIQLPRHFFGLSNFSPRTLMFNINYAKNS